MASQPRRMFLPVSWDISLIVPECLSWTNCLTLRKVFKLLNDVFSTVVQICKANKSNGFVNANDRSSCVDEYGNDFFVEKISCVFNKTLSFSMDFLRKCITYICDLWEDVWIQTLRPRDSVAVCWWTPLLIFIRECTTKIWL